MAIPAAHLMTDSLVYAPISGRDAAGDPTFGAQVTAACRIESASDTVRDSDGNEVMPKHVVNSLVAVPLESKLWLVTEGDNPAVATDARRPISVKHARLPRGGTLYDVAL